jgi:hypothetical protein
MAAQQKNELEKLEIKQKLKHNRITIIVSIIATLFSLISYLYNLHEIKEQRREEQEKVLKLGNISRMEEIRKEFDENIEKMFNTIEIINSSFVTFVVLNSINKSLNFSKLDRIEFINSLENIKINTLKLNNFKEVSILNNFWQQKKYSFSPDFELLFNKELTLESSNITKMILAFFYQDFNPNSIDSINNIKKNIDNLQFYTKNFKSKLSKTILKSKENL